MATNGKRPASLSPSSEAGEVPESSNSGSSSKRARSQVETTSVATTTTTATASTSTSSNRSVSLHQWLHPTLPTPIKTHSPPLHSSSSTFLSFTISFEPPVHSHISSVVTLEKEVRRIVRELDVVREVGELVMRGDEGAFADGEGRAPGRGKSTGKERAREPDHRMWAVRTLGLREGKDGTGGEGDYQLLEANFDDNEKYGGQTIMRVLQEQNAVDVITICCRWYGGDMIGPIRFQHITTTALTSLKLTLKAIGLRDLRTSLDVLDEEISDLRSALAAISSFMNGSSDAAAASGVDATGTTTESKAGAGETGKGGAGGGGGNGGGGGGGGQYDSIEDEAKLQRLVVARERTKAALEKKLASSGA
ncbi:hypothetical protein I316_01825 [Kwoniella heveanensis BCC8398]|uniref:Impact N-terminal domain-containing protein n=1 Tax=Kwoniella heveanensis BCC8398 TaxID=1296120 RepID=A0A1B9H003_9TREE|nr:hypothetical protein I316_01825 [Kwoniella heveanensis BCC8398]